MNCVALHTLQPGDKGIIEQIKSSAAQIRQRLLEMGLTRGTVIELVRFAPMGDPIEIAVRGYRLSLRRVEAESILLRSTS